MREQSPHAFEVDAWVDRLPKTLAPEQLIAAFEKGFTALWSRAQHTLGDVTVSAIVDRLLHDASAQFPLLAVLKVEEGSEVQFSELARRVRPEDAGQIREAMRWTLIHCLTVMGNLTADILSPALHAALASTTVEDLSTNGDRPPLHAAHQNQEREGMER